MRMVDFLPRRETDCGGYHDTSLTCVAAVIGALLYMVARSLRQTWTGL